MKVFKLLAQTFFYIVVILNLIFIVALTKVSAAFFCEQLIYKILFVGDLLAILDIGDFINVIVFAILGMGFGLASGLLPKYAQVKTSVILLLVVVPLIFSTSAFVRYTFWIEDFAAKENISYNQAENITNSFFTQKYKVNGFLGYYLYTANFPILPTNNDEITKADQLEQKVKSEFLSVTKLIKIQPEIVSALLVSGVWSIRFFYFSLSVLTTIAHFSFGRQEILKLTKPKKGFKSKNQKFPPIPPRYKPGTNQPLEQQIRRRVRNS